MFIQNGSKSENASMIDNLTIWDFTVYLFMLLVTAIASSSETDESLLQIMADTRNILLKAFDDFCGQCCDANKQNT